MSRLQFLFATFLVLTFVVFSVNGQDAGFGQTCSLSTNCRSDLTCINERCECRHPRHQNYDFTRDRCVSFLFGPCIDIVDGETVDVPCVSYAECRNETGFPECMCRPGMRQVDRNCKAEFGEPCRFNSDCSGSSFPFSINAMVCKNERCDCGNLEMFDEANNGCIGLVGSFCGTGFTCVEGATCERFSSFDGICRCTGAFTPTPDRRCTLSPCPGF